MVLHRFDGAQDIRDGRVSMARSVFLLSRFSFSSALAAEVKAGVDSTLPTGGRYEEGQGGGGGTATTTVSVARTPPSHRHC